MMLTGSDLLQKVIVNDDLNEVAQSVIKALRLHIYGGDSLDSILQLRSTTAGTPHPRRQLLLELRGRALIESFTMLQALYGLPFRSTVSLLFDLIQHPEECEIPELTPFIDKINLYGDTLGLKLSSSTALYNCILSLQHKTSQQ